MTRTSISRIRRSEQPTHIRPIHYSGNVYANSGNYYTGTDNKSFIVKVTTAGATTGALASRAKYEYSTDGGITWSNEITAGTGGADTTADIVIDSTNKTLYKDGAAITLSEGTYTGSDLATELQTKLGGGYSVSYDGGTRKFTITNNTGKRGNLQLVQCGIDCRGSARFRYGRFNSGERGYERE